MNPGIRKVLVRIPSSRPTAEQRRFHCRQCRATISQGEDIIIRMPGNEFALFNHRVVNVFFDEDEVQERGVYVLARVYCVHCPNFLGWKLILNEQPLEDLTFSGTSNFVLAMNSLLSWDGTRLRYADTNLVCRDDDENVYRYLCCRCEMPIVRGGDHTHRVTRSGFALFNDKMTNVRVDLRSRVPLIGGYSMFDVNCHNFQCRTLLGKKMIPDAQPPPPAVPFMSDTFMLMLNMLLRWDGTSNRYADTYIEWFMQKR